MPDPNLPDDGTRRSPPPLPGAVKNASTGDWSPASPGIPPRIGRFEVRAVLGEGAFGRVYLGFDSELEREVAIKVPKPDGFTPEFRDAFLRENRLAAIIHHANICPIYEVGTDGAVPYIVMRYVAGGTLAGLLKRLATPMPARNAVAIARKLALGLAAAHGQKIIHRDLKPANVLYDEVNREVLLADFGLARFIDQASASSAGVPKGTPAYMAPEQARGLADVIGPHSDVYSLGVMLYEMVTGGVPFRGSIWEVMRDHCETPPRPPSSLRPGLDARFDALCLKAMAKKPADRYASAKVFAMALSEYLHGSGSGAIEELMLAEEIGDDGSKHDVRDGSSLSAAFEIDDDTEGPAHALRETSIPSKDSGSVRHPVKPPAAEPKEVILCPKCKARMQVPASRTKPVDCPLCNCCFAVGAGRQALARSLAPPPKATPVAPASAKPKTRRPEPRERLSLDDDDDDRSRGEWLTAARGLRLAWIGTLLTGLFLIGIGITILATANFDATPTKTAGSSTTSSTYDSKSTRRDTPSSADGTTHVLYSVMGFGIAIGIGVTGVGRFQAGRLPRGVSGGWLATFSAVAGCLAAICVLVPSILAYRLLEDTPSGRTESVALGAAGLASAVALVLMLASDFAFTSYLTALGREIGRRAPRHMTTLAKIILWIVLSCVIIGAASGGAAALIDARKAPGFTFFTVLAGAAAGLTLLLLPFWGSVMFVLHARAAVVVGAYARDEA